MGHIVDGGKIVRIGGFAQHARQQSRDTKPRIATKAHGVNLKIHANRKELAAQIIADMATVQECFGSSQSEALRLALHLTASAVRAGRIP